MKSDPRHSADDDNNDGLDDPDAGGDGWRTGKSRAIRQNQEAKR